MITLFGRKVNQSKQNVNSYHSLRQHFSFLNIHHKLEDTFISSSYFQVDESICYCNPNLLEMSILNVRHFAVTYQFMEIDKGELGTFISPARVLRINITTAL